MKNFVKNIEEIICGFFLISMILIVIVNVFLRYFLSYSIPWAEEVSTICFVWAVFVGASATYKHKMDIGIDMLVLRTPEHIQKIIKHIVNFLLLLINGYIFYMSIIFTKIAYIKPTAVLGVSSAVFNSALVVGFGLITFHTIRFIIQDFSKSEIAGSLEV